MARFELNITAETAEEVQDILRSFIGGRTELSWKRVYDAPEIAKAASPAPENVATATETPEPAPTVEAPAQAEPAKRTRAKKVDPAPVAAAPVTAEVAAQDAADEAAENPAPVSAEKVLTIQDVKDAAAPYTLKYGIQYAQADLGPHIKKFAPTVPELPCRPDSPEDQAVLRELIDTFTNMAAENPHNRPIVAGGAK